MTNNNEKDLLIQMASIVDEPSSAKRIMLAHAFLQQVEALIAYKRVVSEQLKHEQEIISKSHELLNGAKIPSNGEGGYGKRQNLDVHQRIEALIKEGNTAETMLAAERNHRVDIINKYEAKLEAALREPSEEEIDDCARNVSAVTDGTSVYIPVGHAKVIVKIAINAFLKARRGV